MTENSTSEGNKMLSVTSMMFLRAGRFIPSVLLVAFGLSLAGTPSSSFANNATPAASEDEYPRQIKANARIRIDRYDPAIDAYQVTVVQEEAVGPLIADARALLGAIQLENAKALRRNPSRLVGNEYQLQSRLKLLSDEEIQARKAKAGRKRK